MALGSQVVKLIRFEFAKDSAERQMILDVKMD